MTLEKVFSSPFIENNFIPNSPSQKRKLHHLTASPKSSDSSSFSGNIVLGRALIIKSPVNDNNKDRRHSSKDISHSPKDSKPQNPSFDSHSSRQECIVKRYSTRTNSESSLKRNSSSLTARTSRTSLGSIPSHRSTCSREILLEFPSSSMPKSSGRSSRSSVAKRSEKNKELKSGHSSGSLQEVLLLGANLKDRRSRSADASPRHSTSCYFFGFMRRKKKDSDRSASPDARDKQKQQEIRSKSNLSCSTPQLGQPSDRSSSPSHRDRRTSAHSQTSSRHPKTSLSSVQQPSVTSPSALLLTSTSQEKPTKYTSRSRPKHRRDRRHKTGKRVVRIHPDVRLRHEDLPPHPSLYKKADVKASTQQNIPQVASGINSSKSKKSNHDKRSSKNFSFNIQSDLLCTSRKNARPESPTDFKTLESGQTVTDHTPSCRKSSQSESPAQAKSTAVSSSSCQNLKETSEDAAQNSRRQSQKSASKTDLEDDSHYQFTTSSSDQLSRRSSRSRSLPSFCGDRYSQDADTKVITDAEDFEFNPTDMAGPLNLSLCGCGFLGMYHLGVVACLSQRGPSFLGRVQKFAGASAGALMAAVLVAAPDKIEESAEHVQNLAREIRKKPLGALTPGYSFTRSLKHMLDDILPEDAHETAQGKLFVSLTNSETRKNEMMSDFKSRDELIQALVASCYIPVYAGIKLPTIRGKKYIDGGLSDNLPRFETGRTITVSPFDGKSDIGPKQGHEVERKAHFINLHNQDIQVSMNNMKKGAHAFFPPKPQTLQEYFEKGRYDASRFLIREGLYEITYPPQQKTVLYESSV